MQILRELPGSDFTGENSGVWTTLYRLDRALTTNRGFTVREAVYKNRLPWVFNAQTARPGYLALYRDLLYAQLGWAVGPQVRLVGFKEVRWVTYKERLDLELGDLRFLLEVFPCARVLFNYREDAEHQAESGFWSVRDANRTKIVDEIQRTNSVLKEAALRHANNSRLVPLSDLGSLAAVQAIVDWLGFPGCRVKALPHSNNKGELTKMSDLMRCEKNDGCVPVGPPTNQYIDISAC